MRHRKRTRSHSGRTCSAPDRPVTAQIGGTGWKTSLFPKDGRYIVPVKAWVRKAEGLDVGDVVTVRLGVAV
jgi:hypothetical protein